jgi:hypothetical protein
MLLQRTIDTAAGYYDFASSGGAVGSMDLVVPVPLNVFLVEFMLYVVTAPTSATSAATISFDVIKTDVSPQVTEVGACFPATVITAMPAEDLKVGINPTNSGDTPFKSLHNFSIGMSIGIEPLTAGQIQFYLRYIGFDF